MPGKREIVIGQALKPFGIHGELKVRPFTESIDTFRRSPELIFDDAVFHVKGVRPFKGTVLVTLEGITTPEQASELTGAQVKTYEEYLPPKDDDEYYWFELIGMKVVTVDGRDLGSITRITRTGANDVLHVEGPYGEVLLPLIDDVVLTVDTQQGKMQVDPMEGMVPDAANQDPDHISRDL